ncbi:MAG TPA: (deoxy)nucleoside triphosphate pyrophosphohydrolase [Frankiaceae bacterium]|nr:(deoxy)nucleoside triphosphate pyrophosphohydrolase [Frankiaceae bacterium]
MDRVVVGAALVDDGRLLAAQRTAPPELAGLWEFPGGKVEPGEDERTALARECWEELGVVVDVGDLLGEVAVPIGTLRVYRASLVRGQPQVREHSALRWLLANEVFDVPWIPVDLELVQHLANELGTDVPPGV